MVLKFGKGDRWKKVLDPIFIYLNTVQNRKDPRTFSDDAKNQMFVEIKKCHMIFMLQRTSNLLVNGVPLQFIIGGRSIPLKRAYVGLAPPGDVGSWQRESKIINIIPRVNINLGDLLYEPQRDGPTLWEIGVPDRIAAEFFIPDPNPKYLNRFLLNYRPNRLVMKRVELGMSPCRGKEPTNKVERGEHGIDTGGSGGFGARDDISSFLPVASDSTDFEASLHDARDYEEPQKDICRPGLGWKDPRHEGTFFFDLHRSVRLRLCLPTSMLCGLPAAACATGAVPVLPMCACAPLPPAEC
ncbi:hypothetical protein Ccrd_026383 [Cynara cardunculus var. scolymus]|uniref:Uncharacterized protein n=1 Tax=Cynara cardunculus var. scolymus TaxID=59895 RepID=A0A103QJQ3_CYNCS|nr:hypothetical protein Ccrd_026383 [Cynara cardunculus var. scolymus]